MATITTDMVKELRAATSAGVLDCRKALEKSDGDFDKAVELLREQGLAAAAKRVGRDANNGVIGNYVHTGAQVAALIEINCETDFVARTDEFQTLARDLAMQVVAARPQFVRREDVPAELVDHEKHVFRMQVLDSDKPANVIERIVDGKLDKYFEEICLLEQPYIKDSGLTVQELLKGQIARLGENIVVRRFVRFELGA